VVTTSREATTRRETPPCCSGYVVGGSATGTWRGRDRWTTSTRLRNSFASSTKRKIVTPETSVVFMSPGSGNGLHLFKEDGPSNLLRGTSAAGSTNCAVARSTSRTFNCRVGPETRFYCNLVVVKVSIIPASECNRWILN
jgi:hypothetical protein